MKNLFKFALAAFTVAMFAVACGNKTEQPAEAAADTTATMTEEAPAAEPTTADTAAADTTAAAAPAEAAPAH